MTSLQTIEQLKQLTLELSNSPLGDYRKVATMFEAIGEVVSILTSKNKEQQILLNDKNVLEQENKTNEARYKTVFENCPDAIFIMHKDIYIDCNKRALEMFECEKTDILNVSPVKFSPRLQPDGTLSVDGVKERIKATIDGYSQHFKWEHLSKCGKPFNVYVRLNRIDLNGGFWLIAYLHKIVKRK